MSTPLITDMAARREKKRNLPLRHVAVRPEPAVFRSLRMANEYDPSAASDGWHKFIGWVGVIGVGVAVGRSLFDWFLQNVGV